MANGSADGTVVEVGCWAHQRRYFFKALGSEPERAREALALIGALFAIERTLVGTALPQRATVRREQSGPLVARFFTWCDGLADYVLDETPLAAAVRYARNQRTALSRFLDDARLPLDNNISERALRRQVVGRKNCLRQQSRGGGVHSRVRRRIDRRPPAIVEHRTVAEIGRELVAMAR